jgi:lipoprotein-anchoring transpeptidase ErfK/SrfK
VPPVAAEGVAIGPVPVAGMTLEQATTAVLQAYLGPITLEVAGRTVSVSPRRFAIRAPVADAVQQALAAAPGTTVPLRAALDAEKLGAYVSSLAKRSGREPVSSRLVLRHLVPVITKGRPGLAIRQLPTRMLLRNAVRSGERAPIVVPTRPVPAPFEPAAKGPVVVIRRGSNRLSLYHGARLVRTFPVATGQAAYPTPLGRFQIVVKWKNPTWYPPVNDDWARGLKPVPPGPGNPLGTRWMGISSPGVGIHGTDDPASIGYSVSHGCIRMQVPSAEWLFDHVTIGTPVFIVPQ